MTNKAEYQRSLKQNKERFLNFFDIEDFFDTSVEKFVVEIPEATPDSPKVYTTPNSRPCSNQDSSLFYGLESFYALSKTHPLPLIHSLGLLIAIAIMVVICACFQLLLLVQV